MLTVVVVLSPSTAFRAASARCLRYLLSTAAELSDSRAVSPATSGSPATILVLSVGTSSAAVAGIARFPHGAA